MLRCSFVLILLLGLRYLSFAEGSKELNPNGGNRVYLYTSTTTTGSLPWATQGLVRVYVQAGETINVGSSVQGLGNGTIVLISPNGNTYTSGTASTTVGRINTRAQEMAGPLPNAGGYTPYTVTAQTAEAGVWSIFFVGSNGTNNGSNTPDEKLSVDPWDQPNNSPYIAAFDVSIRNVANTAFIPGRAYMNLLEGTMGDFDAKFTGKLNVLTNDGYIYEVNANGLAGNAFAFFSNNKGFKNGANPSYLSQDGTSVADVHPPLSEDTATDVTHKLFFNDPAADLPVSAPARTTTGLSSSTGSATTTWLKTTPVSPALTNFSFVGKEGTANQAGANTSMGGYFIFDANQTGNYSIKIDANRDGDFTDASDRIITNSALTGVPNKVFWDGLDGAGVPVLGVFNGSAIQIILRAGEVHFPLLDVENNPAGIIITRKNGVGAGDQTVYWNDSNISSTTNPSSPLNASVNGESSGTNGHKWGSTGYSSGSFGNNKGLDTWTYVFSTPVAPSVPIEFLRANLEVLPIAKSKITGICIGQQQTYTVSVRNNGPSAVSDALFSFTFPAELTGVVVTPVLTSGTASVVSSNIVGTQYNASLNMNNASVLTFTITGTVSSLPPSNALAVKATVMRPADVYDPDATNPDADIPSDPQLECDSAPSGMGCNNIQNDSTPVLVSNISIANVSEAEGSGGSHNMTFTVTASPANANCDITVNWAVTFGTATSSDFAGANSGTATIPAGQATTTFTIPIVTDQIIEANETFTVTLSNPSSGGVITTATATGTIVDDDNILVNKALVITATDGAEGVSPGATFTIGFPTGITADQDTEIQYTLTGTAAGNGADYTGPTTGTIIIPALTNSITITLPVIDDVILEGNETVIVTTGTITTPYSGINVSNSPLTLNIADDDNAILISGPAQVVEGNAGVTYVTFRVSLDITTSNPFTVEYLTEDGVATVADNDYLPVSGTLNFTGTNPGEYHDIQIAINGDLRIEGNESFKVKLENLSHTFGGLLTISGSPATMSIIDDDNNAANKTITITKVDGAEGGADAEFIFSFPTGVSTDAATIISYTLGGVAVGNGTDYNGVTTGTVTIAAGANSGSFSRSIVDDLIIEGSESLIITTGTVTNSKYNGIGVSNSPFPLNIIDNDNTVANNTITLSSVLSGSEPSSNGQFRVSYPAGIVRSTPTTVNYSIAGTATNGLDYTTLSGSVIIPAYSNSAPIDVLVKDDQVIEPLETVSLSLTSAASGSVSLNVNPATETINITDNDNIPANNIITLTKVSDAEEGLVEGQFKVSFPTGYVSSVPTTVNYVIAGTASNGVDYASLTGQVIIPAGANSADINIVVTDDLIIESTETVSLGLSTATNTISLLSVSPSGTVTADIRDNDNIAGNSIITLTKVSDGAEPGTNPQFLVSYPAGVTSAAATTVNFIISGTALNGTDYSTLGTSVVIPAGANSTPVVPIVLNDQFIETTETIILTLTTATSSISVPGLTVSPSTGVSADIIDDDNTPANTKITLTKTADGAEPGTKASFTLSYPAGITNSAPTIVNYIIGGTATYGSDYTLPDNTTVTIPANTNSVVIDATVSDDFIIEPTETITIDLITASSSTISTITLEPVGAVSADIADNDNTVANKTISITKIDGVEGMLNGSFTFSFPPGITASAPTVISFNLTGTADGGTDYNASPSSVSVTIPAGQNSVTLPLLVLEDDIIEDVETVILTTTSVSNSDLSGIVVSNSPISLNISDNDDYTTLTVSDATVTEGNSGFVSLDFTVSLGKATGRSFSVKYTTEDGTATAAGNDYLSKQDILNFSGMPGESFTVSVQVRGDQMIEMNETFKFRLYDLSDPFGGRLSFGNSTGTGTITDDDLSPANASITISSENGSETGPVPGAFTFSFPSGVSADAPTIINFGLSGTATGTDYTGAGTSSITIPAGVNSITLPLSVIDDSFVENTETVVLTSGSVSSPYGITVANSPQSFEIADNDNATLTISGATVTEGNSGTSTLSFTVTLDKDTGSPFTVEYATADGTATVADNDYTAKSGTLSFSGTAGSQTITVSVKADQKVEPDENISITISNLSSSFGGRLSIPVAGSTATGTITNDDSGVITVTSTDGMEAGLVAGSFTFSFPAGVTMDAPTTISYSLSGTAESGSDYNSPISGSITIPVNTTSISLPIPVLADLLVEDTETVILTTGIISSPYTVTVGNSPHSLNIIDKDQAVVSLSGPATIIEGDNGATLATYTVTLNQATTGSFTVDYATANGTATLADNDYESSSGRLTFAGTAGETQTFTVQINGDKKIEADENFSVRISNPLGGFSNLPAVQTTPVVSTIKNDDSGVITITSTNGSETGPTAGTFTFSFPADVSSDAPTIIYLGLTGTAAPTDYTGAGTSFVTIPLGENSVTLTLPVINDALTELTETVILSTAEVTSPYPITVANSPQSLNIADNDNATLSISGASVSEGNSGTATLSFTVTLDKDTGSPFTVDYTTSDGTASTADNDYTPASGTLTFNGTAGTQTIVVSVTSDKKVEADESFSIAISNLSSHFDNRLSIPVAGSVATGTITNDDAAVITISSANGSENGPVPGTFTFSFPADVTVDVPTTINYTLSGTSESGKDYTEPISGSITIPARANSAVLTLTVADDMVVEDTETIILTTGIITSPYAITVGNSPQSLNIIDNDQAAVTLTAQPSITEGDSRTQTVTYTATLDKATQGGFTVEYATSDGTATLADNDYESSTGILTFSGTAGETKTFTVVINGDQMIEANENFSVMLSNLASAFSNRPVVQSTPVVTSIENDDNDLGVISITSTDGSENGPLPGTFTFSFPTGVSSDAPTTINFSLSGTATAPDYTGAGLNSITIPARQNSITLTLPVADDSLIEGTETITLTTGTVNGPYPITVANSPKSLSITDNDNATLTISGETKTEGGTGNKVLNFTVTLDNATAAPFTVDFSTSDGTAKVSDNDYLPQSGTLSFSGAAGETRTIAVTVRGDKKIEADENFTVSLSNLSKDYNNTLGILSSPATGIISNDDTGVITITPGNGSETGPSPATFTFSLPADMTMDAPATIHYTLAGTAESVKDYTGAISGSVILDTDENSVTLSLPVIDDALIEDPETVILSTGVIAGPYSLTVDNSPQTLTIVDNDQATVTLTGLSSITEGNSGTQSITYTVTLDKATHSGFTVDYATADGIATVADNDYESSSGRLTFAGTAGETRTFTVLVNADKKIEAAENFSVTLSNLITSSGNPPLLQSTPVVTSIENDDSGVISITSANGSETGPIAGTFTFSFPAGVSSDAATTINFGLSGTATAADYTGAGTSFVVIPVGENSITLTLPVVNDLITEGKETVILTTGTVGSPYGISVANSPQSLEIADNDNSSLSISGASVVEGNSGTTALSFTVTLDKATRPFSVDFATADGTANTATNDYSEAAGTLNFAGNAGESQTITVTVIGDGKVEADETLSMTISNLSDTFDGLLSIVTGTATGTITNDDSGVITITSTDGMEAGPVSGSFTFSFPAGVTMDAPTTISYSVSGTAESGSDFNSPIGGSITIPANTTSISLPIPVLADLVVEDTETVILTTGIISSPYAVTVGNSPQSLNIIDKDQAVISLSGPATITEGDNGPVLATYTVTLSQATTGSFTVDYATANGTATLADNDYESSSGRLTFAGTAGESQTFTVQINGDKKIEADENISVRLSNVTGGFSNLPLAQTTAVVTTITNDDAGVLSITSSNGSETGPVPGTFTFSFPANVTSDAATTIYFGLTGTATGADFTGAVPLSVTLPANSNSVALNLAVYDDLIIEGTETVVLTTGTISSPYGISVSNAFHSLNIADNDNATLSLAGSTITEGDSGTKVINFTVTLDKATSPFSVDYASVDGTATIADNDYSALSGTLNFSGTIGESKTIAVTVTGDKKIEADESFSVILSNLSSHYNNTLVIDGSPAMGIIANDDAGTITVTPVNGSETGPVAGSFTFSLPAGTTADAPVTINYTLSGSAESVKDYSGTISGSLTIDKDKNSTTLTLTVIDDALVEDTETIVLNTGLVTSPYPITVANSPQSLTISDNDQSALTLTGPATVAEGHSGTQNITYTITLDKATGSPFTIDYATSNGTASSTTDYNASSGTLTFTGLAGESKDIAILINGDQRIEADETFSISLSDLSNTFNNRLSYQTSPVVTTIVNDDSGAITITSENGSETGPVPGAFTFSFPSGVSADAPTIINFGLSGTATGTDYTGAGTSSITIPAGVNSIRLPLSVIDDSFVENTETVVLTSGSVSSPYGITVANSPQSLEIADNDNATLTISGATVTEGNSGTSTLSFTVTLDKDTGSPFTVEYATADGTATVADNDYTAKSGTLSFSGTAGSQTITVPVRGDQKVEPDENISITISNLSSSFGGRLSIPVAGSRATGTITNDDSGVITITSTDGMETGPVAGSFTFSFPVGVTMDAPTTISYTLSGTAESGEDYTSPISGSITIPANTTSISLPIPVLADLVVEDTETVILTTGIISSPYAVTIGNSPHSLNIIDKDQAVISLSGPATITEGDNGATLATYTVTLTQATTGSFTVDYATTNGTATISDNDYESSSGRLTFAGAAGESQTFTVQINGDKKIEADENFSVRISNPLGGFSNLPLAQTTAVVTTVTNDDAGIIEIIPVNGSETGPVAGSFTFRFKDGVVSDAPTVVYYGLTGTALSSGPTYDYTSNVPVGSVTIPANTNSFTLNLDVNDDQITEGTETAVLTTGAVSSPYGIAIVNSPQSLEIADNDNAILQITGGTENEGHTGTTFISFTVVLNNATGPFNIDYKTTDGTATIADKDYNAATGTLHFNGNAGESRTITVAVTGDKKIEANENFSLELSNLSNHYNNTLTLSASTATGTILDDDNTINNKKIKITTVDGAEGGANASIKFSFPEGLSTDGTTTIHYTLGGTARDNGIDYNVASTGTLYILPGENGITLPLVINDDPVMEGTETVIVNAGAISNDKYTGLTLDNAPQTLTIADNDAASLSIAGPVTVIEGNNGSQKAVFKVSLSHATGTGFSVNYSTADGTASGSDNDYIPVPNGTVTFEGYAGESQNIEIVIIGDTKIERNEEYQVRLNGLSSNFGGGLIFATTSATGIIMDDDNIPANRHITITKTDGTEGAANGSFVFSLPGGVTLDAPTTINYTLAGTARGAGVDYNNQQIGTVIIPAGQNYAELIINIRNDSALEATETVIITTGEVVNNNYNDIKVLNSPFTLLIEDNDNASLSISGPVQVTEGNTGTANAVFRVRLNNATGDPFTVNYTTKDGTATVADKDYIATSGTLTFSGRAGEFQNIIVPVQGDLKIEKNEEFTLELGGLSNDFDHRLLIAGNPARGVIVDDDNNSANSRISISGVSGAEGGNDLTVKFSFPAGVSTDDWTTINYILSGTALGNGVDHDGLSSGTVVIPPGENSATLALSVVDDNVIESVETVIVSVGIIENNAHSGLAASGSPLSLNIIDNDRGELKLSGPVVVSEGNSGPTLLNLSVTLTAGTGSPFSIGYTTMDGTARAGDNDYVAKTASLNFAGTPGEVQNITILVNGDYKIEGDEEFNVVLRNLSDDFDGKLTYSNLPAKARILNDDNGTISISKTDAKEGAGGGSFTFSLSPGVYTDKPIIIPYNLSGTAFGNSIDYLINTSGSITLPAGQNKVTLNLVVNDDAIIEPRETVKISTGIVLSSMPNAILVDNSPFELYIEDNDASPIIITNPVITKEGNSGYSTAAFTATLPLSTAAGFTLDYATADGTASLADDDYKSSSGRLTFAGIAGEVQKINVLIKGDVKVEGDEKYAINLDGLSNPFEGRLTLEFNTVTGVIHDDDLAPVAVADVISTPEDTPVTFSLVANDMDFDGVDPTSIRIVSQPVKGSVGVNRDGTVTYTPELNDNGTHYFTYTVKDLTGLESNEANVTVTIVPVSDAPVAEDDSYFVRRDGTLRENVSLNDSDLDGDLLRFKVTVPPSRGTLVSFNQIDGSFVYTPTSPTFTGFDEFTYQVSDPGGMTDEAKVTIGIQPRTVAKLSPTLVTIKEGEEVTITAVLSEPLLQDVVLMLEYNGDAKRDSDYVLSGDVMSFSIKAGDTTTTGNLTVRTKRDYLIENDEVLEVNIASATPTEYVEIESGSEVTITEMQPDDKPIGPEENGDIKPDPYTSPDGDGVGNESFVIHNIDKYPDNEVVIFNRWGNEVYRIKGYNNKDRSFTGVANAGVFVNKGATLPDGVYYFIIYTKVDNVMKLNKGYVIVKR